MMNRRQFTLTAFASTMLPATLSAQSFEVTRTDAIEHHCETVIFLTYPHRYA